VSDLCAEKKFSCHIFIVEHTKEIENVWKERSSGTVYYFPLNISFRAFTFLAFVLYESLQKPFSQSSSVFIPLKARYFAEKSVRAKSKQDVKIFRQKIFNKNASLELGSLTKKYRIGSLCKVLPKNG
jgi:hypothetical protein